MGFVTVDLTIGLIGASHKFHAIIFRKGTYCDELVEEGEVAALGF